MPADKPPQPRVVGSSEPVPDLRSGTTAIITGISNREFLEKYSLPGCIGLSAGETLIDRAIKRAERHLDPAGRWGSWSHAFIVQGYRVDGFQWVLESDLQFHRKHVHLGVQENRLEKYYDEGFYQTLAILDFGLTAEQLNLLLREGLNLVADRTGYSVRELAGTLLALREPRLRGRPNLLAQDRALYCSAFVQHLYQKIGLDLNPGVHGKNTTPEDLARSSLPHRRYILERPIPPGKLTKLRGQLRRRVGVGLARLKASKGKTPEP